MDYYEVKEKWNMIYEEKKYYEHLKVWCAFVFTTLCNCKSFLAVLHKYVKFL